MHRPNYQPYQVIPNSRANPANTGSMASSIISAPTIISQLTQISYAVSWVGTSPVGSISVEVSNDYSVNNDGSIRNAGIWNPVVLSYSGTNTTGIAISGNSGNGIIDIASTGLYAVRLHYTAVSGTGTLAVIINGKVA